MRRCEICGAKLTGRRKICPLCGQTLDSSVTKEDFEVYPEVPIRLTYRGLNWIISLWGVGDAGTAGGAETDGVASDALLLAPSVWGVAGAHVILLAGVRKWRNLPKSVMYAAVACVLISGAGSADGLAGLESQLCAAHSGRRLEKLLLCPCVSVRGKNSAYGIYFFLSSLWVATVLILALTGVITLWLPTLVATLLAAILMVILTALQGRDFLSELSRRFHI